MKKLFITCFIVFLSVLFTLVILNHSQAALINYPNKVLFTTYRDGNAEVYSMKPDSTFLTRLTNNAAYDGQPSVSSDATKFVFVSDRVGNKEIYCMNTDGTSLNRKTYNNANDRDPALTADGTKIAFVSDRDGNYEIYTMAFNGAGLTRLTYTSISERYPVWSPDGAKIAFAANNAIWVMNADGSNLMSVTNMSGIQTMPSWSPQGDKVAFSVEDNGNVEIYVINIIGSGLTKLTNDPAFDQDPCWSPDGAKIIFTSDRSGNNDLYVMNAIDGSGLTNLTNNIANDEEPYWGGMTSLTTPTPITIVTPSITPTMIVTPSPSLTSTKTLTPTPSSSITDTPTPTSTVTPTITLNYWDSFGFGNDDWITSAPNVSILSTFSYGGQMYPALVATEYGIGRAVFAEGSTFSELYNITNHGNVCHQLFVNSVNWVAKGKSPSLTKVLATYGHRELLTYGGDGIKSNAVEALREKGYSVDVFFDIPSSLAGYDVVIMPGLGWLGTPGYSNPIYWSGASGHALTNNEVSVLLNFIQDGGGLVTSIEYGTGANWISPIGNPMGVTFAHISNVASLVGNRIIEHPIFLKW